MTRNNLAGHDVPTFALPATFLGVQNTNRAAAYCIAGIPYDLGTSNRAGTREGPAAIRRASRMLVDGDHPIHRRNPKSLDLADIGNFEIVQSDVTGSLRRIEEQADMITGHLIVMGGDHSISLALLRSHAKRHGPLGLVHFDAHLDTWPDNFGGGSPFGHGNPFYHAIAEGLIDPKRMVQIGIRSPCQNEVMDWTRQQGSRILTASHVHERRPFDIAYDIRCSIARRPTYLTIDIDVLDPAYAPGTGTPEIGGLSSWQMQSILRSLCGIEFIGMDIVEVAPAYDVSEITSLAAATFVWEYLSLRGTNG